MQKLDASNINNFLASSYTKPVVVKFGATWCGPCQAMAPILQQAADALQGVVVFGEVDADQSAQLTADFGVTSLPTMIKFINGTPVARFSGNPGSVQAIRREMSI